MTAGRGRKCRPFHRIEFLWVGSQMTPGMGRVADDPRVGSQMTPVP